MTRKGLRRRIILIIFICALLVVIGVLIFLIDPNLFQTFKDFLLLLVAIPATLLADYFQKRNNFEDALRVLWSNILHSVSEARQYTYRTNASEDLFRQNLSSLSRSIDEVRSVYKNVGENKGDVGYYPFESLKLIYNAFKGLGYGELEPGRAEAVRDEMDHYWKNFKECFLWEFDRPQPESVNTPHTPPGVVKNNFKPFAKNQ